MPLTEHEKVNVINKYKELLDIRYEISCSQKNYLQYCTRHTLKFSKSCRDKNLLEDRKLKMKKVVHYYRLVVTDLRLTINRTYLSNYMCNQGMKYGRLQDFPFPLFNKKER